MQLADGAARVQRQGAPAVGVGRRRDGRHDARRLRFEQRPEAPEVSRREPDVGAAVPQGPLERTEEARQIVNSRARKQFRADGEQGAVDPQVGPVRARAERAQECGRLAGAEW